jgi:hypothetical protein
MASNLSDCPLDNAKPSEETRLTSGNERSSAPSPETYSSSDEEQPPERDNGYEAILDSFRETAVQLEEKKGEAIRAVQKYEQSVDNIYPQIRSRQVQKLDQTPHSLFSVCLWDQERHLIWSTLRRRLVPFQDNPKEDFQALVPKVAGVLWFVRHNVREKDLYIFLPPELLGHLWRTKEMTSLWKQIRARARSGNICQVQCSKRRGTIKVYAISLDPLSKPLMPQDAIAPRTHTR